MKFRGRGMLVTAGALVMLIALMFSAGTAHAIIVRSAVAYRPRPVLRAAAVVGTVAVTAAVVGSVVNSLPPQCNSVVVGGVAYQQCGSTWYRPAYAGTTVNYTVVNPPR
jgi:hypothetical protein